MSYILATGSDAVLQKPTKDLPGRTMSLTSLACGKWLDCAIDCPLLICCPKNSSQGRNPPAFFMPKSGMHNTNLKTQTYAGYVMCKTYEHIHQVSATNRFPTILATLFYQPPLQHFSTGPFCNTPQSTTLLKQPFPATILYNTLPNISLFSSSNTSMRQFFATTPLPQNDDHKTTTKKTPLLQNTTQHSHDTAQHQYNATCFRHNKSTIVNTAQPSQPRPPLFFTGTQTPYDPLFRIRAQPPILFPPVAFSRTCIFAAFAANISLTVLAPWCSA